MSTLKVTNIQHPSASTAAITLASDGTATIAGGGGSSAPSLLSKADAFSVCLTRTGAGTAQVKAGTKVLVGTTLVEFATATSVTMPSLTAGTDYYVYALSNGTAQAVAATGAWPTPVGSPPANSQLIGGFHYAPGGNATGTSGGNTTPSINEFSLWDLKWRPTSLDPRGMTLVADAFWMDIYLLNRAPDTNGTSKNAADIADGATGGTTTAIIPAKFGGNGTTRYALQDWWSTAECLMAYGKRLPTVAEAATAFYGVTENVSRGNDPVTTGLGTTNAGSSQTDEKFTSKWGVIQATGVMYVWGQEHGGGTAAASWANTNGGRGQVYQQENAVFLSGHWNAAAYSGSRSASWNNAPSFSSFLIGGRGACDHLLLV